MLTHRRHDSKTPIDTNHVVLFAEDGNEGYGDHGWELMTELQAVEERQDVITFAAEFYGVDEDEALELVNPDNIVDSAGAWDDPGFVSDLWQAMESGSVSEAAGFRTWDGAVVLDAHSVELRYFEDEDEDE